MIVPFTADELRDLPGVISAPRFATYLQAMGNDREAALRLYRWNLQVSSAFIVPLQVCEVAARNAVEEAIAALHGGAWPWSSGFIRSVPRARRGYCAVTNLQEVTGRMGRFATTGKVVAEIHFAFWEKILTVGQDQRLWQPHLRTVFPGAPVAQPIAALRDEAHTTLRDIRKLRNRIAHHEPIFTRNIADEYALVRKIVSWRSPTAADWMDKIQGVTALIAQRP